MPQPLPPKEASHFRSVVRYYEDKQYKRGIKSADLILKKHPKHGDTMAMKALILNAQGKTDEAFALGKEALTADMKSHICWHVYGLLYRANKNFEEAAKAYKFALRLEPESAQIQRDLAVLQIQMRDYAGYVQSRTAMLKARSQLRQNWSALAMAHHLAGDLAEAEKVLTTYEGTLKQTPSKNDLEHSEAVLYKNSLIMEQGDYERALAHLEDKGKLSLDRLAVLEKRAECHAKLGHKEEAVKAYRVLLERNPEHAEYYDLLEGAMGISKDDTAARKAIYDEYAEKNPRCDAAKRIPLNFLTGQQFSDAAASYLAYMFNKGVPSTFANLKHLYSDESKKQTLASLTEKYISAPDTDKTSTDKGEAAGLYFLSQHYNYHLSRDLGKAMEYVDKSIEKDPKSVEAHMTKARILKHQGEIAQAAKMMDTARKLDLKDRYINSKCAKYQLRNNENEKALKTVGLFTRAETVGGPLADLLDMQCMWFLTEDGEAYARNGNTALALKRFHQIANIFDVWHEDQFDFHTFSLRKGMLRAYIDMVRWEDHVRDHPFFSRAALDAIRIYVSMADRQAARAADGSANGSAETEEEALERKKAAKKAKKEQQRLEREEAEREAKQDPNKKKDADGEEVKKKDEDPLGLKLAATEQPLEDAMRFLTPLLQAQPKNLDAQVAGYEVQSRRKKYILALKCVQAAKALDASSEKVQEMEKGLKARVEGDKEVDAKVAELVKAQLK